MIEYVHQEHPGVIETLEDKQELDDDVEAALAEVIEEFKEANAAIARDEDGLYRSVSG